MPGPLLLTAGRSAVTALVKYAGRKTLASTMTSTASRTGYMSVLKKLATNGGIKKYLSGWFTKVRSSKVSKWLASAALWAGYDWVDDNIIDKWESEDKGNRNSENADDPTKSYYVRTSNNEKTGDVLIDFYYSQPWDTDEKIDERVPLILKNLKTPIGGAKERSGAFLESDKNLVRNLSYRTKIIMLNHFLSRLLLVINSGRDDAERNLMTLKVLDTLLLGDRLTPLSRIAGGFIDSQSAVDNDRLKAITTASLNAFILLRTEQREEAVRTVFSNNTNLDILNLGLAEDDPVISAGSDSSIPGAEAIAATYPGAFSASIDQIMDQLGFWQRQRVDDDLNDDEGGAILTLINMLELDIPTEQDYNKELLFPNYDNRRSL